MCKIEINKKLSENKIAYIQFLIDQEMSEYAIENTQNLFTRIQLFEANMMDGKALEEWSFNDACFYLRYLQSANKYSLKLYTDLISAYIIWCKNEFLTRNSMDFAELLDEDYIEKELVNKAKVGKKYIKKEDFNEVLNSFGSYQEKAIFMLIWSGVLGKSYSEIRDLKVQDINFDNHTITLTDREIKMNEELEYVMKKTLSERTINNRELVDSDYVIKAQLSKRSDGDTARDNIIMNRINKVKQKYAIKHLTADSIYKSGLFYRATEDLEVTKENYIAMPKSKAIVANYFVEVGGMGITMAYRNIRDYEKYWLEIED